MHSIVGEGDRDFALVGRIPILCGDLIDGVGDGDLGGGGTAGDFLCKGLLMLAYFDLRLDARAPAGRFQ